MIEKLRAFFHVRELQDFRTLYTDPPISFSEEFPDVPKPARELSPEWLAARWVTHDLYGEDMPDIAAAMLEAGYDTPALRRLAGEMKIECSADIEGVVARVFRELSVPYPLSKDQAKLISSRQIARDVIAGKRNAWAAASHLTIAIWDRRTEDPDLRLISDLLDSLDWDAVNRDKLPELTSELVAVFARLGVQTEREKRIASLGLLEGQGWIADDFDAPLPDDLLALFEGRDEPSDKWR